MKPTKINVIRLVEIYSLTQSSDTSLTKLNGE